MPTRQLAQKLSPRGWAVLGGAAAVAILFLYIVFRMASAPSYSTLLTGVEPAQTGKITSALATQGIGYELQNGGTAVAVDSGKTAQARVALATAGLLGSNQPGFELFDKQQLGASNFQQQITYQRALEGQLDQTIDSIQGVSSAQVQLVLPNAQDQLFGDNSSPSRAAVLLSDSGSLDPSAVQGIAQLVASSVPGLTLDKVTITGSSGRLLWPTGDSTDSSGTSGSLLAKQAADTRYDALMAAQVNAMLAQTLGQGKAQVEVNADLNADQATSDTLTYANKGVPLTQQTQTEKLTGNGASGAAGTAGTTGKIPAYAQTGTGSGTSNYSNTTANVQYGVNKTVTHDVIAPGKINSQSVSVLVDKAVPAAEVPAIKAAVESAVGFQPKRDTISVGQMAFATQPTTPGTTPSPIMSYAKYAVVGIGALVFLMFVGRLLRSREREAFAGEPTWLRELSAAPRPLAALDSAEGEQTRVMQLRTPVNATKRQIEDLVERDPDRVAQQVRAWMAEE
jgi:flagellar M-ring protein FliF